MPIKVGNRFAETATFVLVEDADGRPAFSVDGQAPERSVKIAGTNKVGARSVERDGEHVTELRDIVGGRLKPEEAGEILDRLTSGEGEGRGPVQGVDGVELAALTSDAFTLRIDGGRAVDTLVFEVGPAFLGAFGEAADLGDGKSRLAEVESGQDFVGATRKSGLRDVLNDGTRNQIDGVEGRAQLLRAALDPEDERVTLLGVEAEEFAVRLANRGLEDTFVFTGRDAERAVARVAGEPIALAGPEAELAVAGPDPDDVFGLAADVEFGPIGGDPFTDVFGAPPPGSATPRELAEYILAGPPDERVVAVDQGDTVRVSLIGAEAVDTVVLPGGLFEGA